MGLLPKLAPVREDPRRQGLLPPRRYKPGRVIWLQAEPNPSQRSWRSGELWSETV